MRAKKQYTEQKPIEINGRHTRNFICFVDSHRPPNMRRNTAGRYRVGAKNAKQARKLLQKVIGFGSITIACEDNSNELSNPVPCGTCVQEIFNCETNRFIQKPMRNINL